MDRAKQSSYIKTYPALKGLFRKIDETTTNIKGNARDKAKVIKLLTITDSKALSLEDYLKQLDIVSEEKRLAILKLISDINSKHSDFLLEIQNYNSYVQASKTSESARKQEQRLRPQIEERAVMYWLELDGLLAEVKKDIEYFFTYYDDMLGVWDFDNKMNNRKPKEVTEYASIEQKLPLIEVKPKHRFNKDTNAIEIEWRPHIELLSELGYSNSFIRKIIDERRMMGAVKKYSSTYLAGAPDCNELLDFVLNDVEMKRYKAMYCEAYVDLSDGDWSTGSSDILMAIVKASLFSDRWGMSEIEAAYYGFLMPYTDCTIPDALNFNTLPGENNELTIFYDTQRFYSHKEVVEEVENGKAFLKLITLHHTCGALVNSKGKYSIVKYTEPKPYPSSCITDPVVSDPYKYSRASIKGYHIEMDNIIERANKVEKDAKRFAPLWGFSLDEYYYYHSLYERYQECARNGKHWKDIAPKLSFKAFCTFLMPERFKDNDFISNY